MKVEVDIQVVKEEDGLWSAVAKVRGESGAYEEIHEHGFPSEPFARAAMRAMVNELTETLTWGREAGREDNEQCNDISG